MTGSISFYHRGMLARTITENDTWITYLYHNGEKKYSITWLEEFNSGKLENIIDNLVYQVPEGDDLFIYKEIIACSLYQGANWITYFYHDGEYISEVQWIGGYTEDAIKRHIDQNIMPFMFTTFDEELPLPVTYPELEVIRPAVTNLVKEASKEHKDIEGYDTKVTEHVNTLMKLFEAIHNWEDPRGNDNAK